MTWLKTGDTAATHQIVMRGGAGGDHRQVNELFGLVVRCAIWSAAQTTDYFIDDGVVRLFAGSEYDRLSEAGRKAGYWRVTTRNGHRGWLLVDDPEFLHIRLKAEIDWERQQKADASNPTLIVPVRIRDGDACRYCGVVVSWGARKGARRGTYDHRTAGKPARSPEDLVVACGGCNSGRRDDPHADEKYPIRPAPRTPYYSASTAAFLARHGHHVKSSERPGSQPDDATSDPAASGSTHPHDVSRRTTRAVDESADPVPTGSVSVGSGRERDGPGSGHGYGSGHRQPKRSRRGRPRTGGAR